MIEKIDNKFDAIDRSILWSVPIYTANAVDYIPSNTNWNAMNIIISSQIFIF